MKIGINKKYLPFSVEFCKVFCIQHRIVRASKFTKIQLKLLDKKAVTLRKDNLKDQDFFISGILSINCLSVLVLRSFKLYDV